ncbi:hypothetical protein [Kitasatospora paranensis]|uniref:Uncharacterized protein n=1 Tax=Kitasatospora paranensis TaxID=258053 RepID=A0ABW2FNI5_9ACTN
MTETTRPTADGAAEPVPAALDLTKPALTEPAPAAVPVPAPEPAEPATVAPQDQDDRAEAPAPAPAPAEDSASAPAPAPDPYAVWADRTVLDEAAAAARKQRRGALLRWGAAALILVLTGTGAALAVTAPDRTDLPGLATPNDGRYAFPVLTLPQLPSGSPAPSTTEAKGRHFADLRGLLLPAPRGAAEAVPSPTASAPGASPSAAVHPSAPASAPALPYADVPWLACGDFAKGDRAADKITQAISEYGCRAATRRVWTAADGTRTEIWLFRLGSRTEATGMYGALADSGPKDQPQLQLDILDLDPTLPAGVVNTRSTAEKVAGLPTVRTTTMTQGDVVASIAMVNPKGVPFQPYRQVSVLQWQLLG